MKVAGIAQVSPVYQQAEQIDAVLWHMTHVDWEAVVAVRLGGT